jgi:hypothetical protein
MQQVGLGSTLLAAAAWVQAETGNVTAARATLVEALTHDSNGNTAKDPILLRLGALALANMGDAAEALAVIDKIEEPRSRAEALLAIAADKRPDFVLAAAVTTPRGLAATPTKVCFRYPRMP